MLLEIMLARQLFQTISACITLHRGSFGKTCQTVCMTSYSTGKCELNLPWDWNLPLQRQCCSQTRVANKCDYFSVVLLPKEFCNVLICLPPSMSGKASINRLSCKAREAAHTQKACIHTYVWLRIKQKVLAACHMVSVDHL